MVILLFCVTVRWSRRRPSVVSVPVLRAATGDRCVCCNAERYVLPGARIDAAGVLALRSPPIVHPGRTCREGAAWRRGSRSCRTTATAGAQETAGSPLFVSGRERTRRSVRNRFRTATRRPPERLAARCARGSSARAHTLHVMFGAPDGAVQAGTCACAAPEQETVVVRETRASHAHHTPCLGLFGSKHRTHAQRRVVTPAARQYGRCVRR